MTKTAKPATIVVRPAKFEDTTNIFRLARKSADDTGKDVTSDAILHHIVNLISGLGYIAVADLSGRIVGVIANQDGSVGSLFVLHGFEDAGIEGALLAHVLKRSRDAGTDMIMTVPVEKPEIGKALESLGLQLVSSTYSTIQIPPEQE